MTAVTKALLTFFNREVIFGLTENREVDEFGRAVHCSTNLNVLKARPLVDTVRYNMLTRPAVKSPDSAMPHEG